MRGQRADLAIAERNPPCDAAFVEVDELGVTHQTPRLVDVCERVGHVAGSARRMVPLQRTAQQLIQPADDVEQAHALATADVERHARGGRRRSRDQLGIDHVVDISEVARLTSVAVQPRAARLAGRGKTRVLMSGRGE